MPDADNGLVFAYALDGKGGGIPLDWTGVRNWSPDQGMLWAHFDYTRPETTEWITGSGQFSELAVESLLAGETRPRSAAYDDGQLLILRGVNMNPGADPEDMVSIRLWIDNHRVISTRRRHLLAAQDLRSAIEKSKGPKTTGELATTLADLLTDRMSQIITDIDEQVDDMEEELLTMESHLLRSQLAQVRREAIALRRYLAPQREAMSRLVNERASWLTELDRLKLREIADRTTRYIEDLDAVRERAVVIQEELLGRLSEQMNKRMFVLSIVAAVFLPLGFLTGLLGINVGGIPGADYKAAFYVFIIFLIGIVAIQLWFFRKQKWI